MIAPLMMLCIFASAGEPTQQDLSWSETFVHQAEDELWPELYFRLNPITFDHEKWLDTAEAEDAEDDARDALEDAFRRGTEKWLKTTDYYKALLERFEDDDVKVRVYYDQFGRESRERLLVDTGYQVELDGDHEPKHNHLEFGVRWSSDNPGFYTRLFNNPRIDGGGYHDLVWYPASDDIEYRVTMSGRKFKWGIKYDYDDRMLRLKLQDFPVTENIRCKVGAYYDFNGNGDRDWLGRHDDKPSWGVGIGLYGRF